MEINKILENSGLKCTKQRIRILTELANAASPVSAEDIYEKTDAMSLSTVYRNLEKLCEKGIAVKCSIGDAEKLYYEIAGGEHHHYAVCLGCKRMKYINTCPVHSEKIDNFIVTGHKLEIYGYCNECVEKIKQ